MRLPHINFDWLFHHKKKAEDNSEHLLFNYGPVKDYNTPAFTQEKMTLWKDLDNNLPVAVKGSFIDGRGRPTVPVARARIKGDILNVSGNVLERLDNLLQHGVYFTRKMTTLVVPHYDTNNNPIQIHAWMYVGNDLWKDKIEWDQHFYKSCGGKFFKLAPRLADPQFRAYYQLPITLKSVEVDPRIFLYLHKNLNDPEIKTG